MPLCPLLARLLWRERVELVPPWVEQWLPEVSPWHLERLEEQHEEPQPLEPLPSAVRMEQLPKELLPQHGRLRPPVRRWLHMEQRVPPHLAQVEKPHQTELPPLLRPPRGQPEVEEEH